MKYIVHCFKNQNDAQIKLTSEQTFKINVSSRPVEAGQNVDIRVKMSLQNKFNDRLVLVLDYESYA